MFTSHQTNYLVLLILIALLFNCDKKDNDKSKTEKKEIIKKTPPKEEIIEETPTKEDIKPIFPNYWTRIVIKNLLVEIYPSERDYLENPLTDSEIKFKKLYETTKYKHFPVAERAELIEKYSLKKDAQFVSRKDSNLIFRLKNGKLKLITNKTVGDGDRSFFYREYLKEIGFFVCFVAPWEGASYKLINDQTGEEFYINGIPKISPDKKRILTTAYDAGYYFNDGNINIWKIENNKLKLDFSYTSDFKIWNSEWVENNLIRFEIFPENDNEMECFGKNGMEALSVYCREAFELKFTENGN